MYLIYGCCVCRWGLINWSLLTQLRLCYSSSICTTYYTAFSSQWLNSELLAVGQSFRFTAPIVNIMSNKTKDNEMNAATLGCTPFALSSPGDLRWRVELTRCSNVCRKNANPFNPSVILFVLNKSIVL